MAPFMWPTLATIVFAAGYHRHSLEPFSPQFFKNLEYLWCHLEFIPCRFTLGVQAAVGLATTIRVELAEGVVPSLDGGLCR